MRGSPVRDTKRAEVSTTAPFSDTKRVLVHYDEWVDGLPVTKSMDPDDAKELAEELLEAAEKME